MEIWPVNNPGYMASTFSYWWISIINAWENTTANRLFSKSRRSTASMGGHILHQTIPLRVPMGWSNIHSHWRVGRAGWFRIHNPSSIQPAQSNLRMFAHVYTHTCIYIYINMYTFYKWICVYILYVYIYHTILSTSHPHFVQIISTYFVRYMVGCCGI